MNAVRRGLVHVGAWAATTAAAVTLSWFGVRSVLRQTAYDSPRALPITGVPTSSPPEVPPAHRPGPASPHASPQAPPPASPRAPGRTRATGGAAVPPPASAAGGDVHSYTVKGGRVVLGLGARAATLVSATPDAGWRMQVWATQPGWLRVTFTSASGAAASTVFCTWNGRPPAVQTYEN